MERALISIPVLPLSEPAQCGRDAGVCCGLLCRPAEEGLSAVHQCQRQQPAGSKASSSVLLDLLGQNTSHQHQPSHLCHVTTITCTHVCHVTTLTCICTCTHGYMCVCMFCCCAGIWRAWRQPCFLTCPQPIRTWWVMCAASGFIHLHIYMYSVAKKSCD